MESGQLSMFIASVTKQVQYSEPCSGCSFTLINPLIARLSTAARLISNLLKTPQDFPLKTKRLPHVIVYLKEHTQDIRRLN